MFLVTYESRAVRARDAPGVVGHGHEHVVGGREVRVREARPVARVALHAARRRDDGAERVVPRRLAQARPTARAAARCGRDGSRTSGDSMSSPNASKPLPRVGAEVHGRQRSPEVERGCRRTRAGTTRRCGCPSWCAASTNARRPLRVHERRRPVEVGGLQVERAHALRGHVGDGRARVRPGRVVDVDPRPHPLERREVAAGAGRRRGRRRRGAERRGPAALAGHGEREREQQAAGQHERGARTTGRGRDPSADRREAINPRVPVSLTSLRRAEVGTGSARVRMQGL